jgi:hypothetical protein
VADLGEVDLKNLLATGFVNFAARGIFEILPLDTDDLGKAFEVLPEGTEGRVRRLDPKSVKEFLCWLREHSGVEEGVWSPLERFAIRALENLEVEMGRIRSFTDLDPRYVRSAILKRRSPGERHE